MKQVLHQVCVETRSGQVLAIGARMLKPAADALLVTIAGQIATGKEREWSNPHLVRAPVN